MPRNLFPILIGILLASYLLLTSYLERKYKKLQTLDSAKQVKYVAYISFYVIFAFLVIIVIRLIVITRSIAMTNQFPTTQFINLSYIGLVVLVFFAAWMVRAELKRYKWYRNNSPNTILASSFLQRQAKLLKGQNFDQAKACLVKVCELLPDNAEIWCRLGFFNELLLQKQDDANQCINKAKLILDSVKEPNKKEIACYENYLGYILCNRGQTEKGFKHIEKSIQLDPNPGRIQRYNEKLAEMKKQDQPMQD